MTSVYETEKIYPPIPPTAPPDGDNQVYRLKKIDELEKFLRSEVESRDKLTKRFKRQSYNGINQRYFRAITAITALEAASIATLDHRHWHAQISVVLASTGLLLGTRIRRDHT